MGPKKEEEKEKKEKKDKKEKKEEKEDKDKKDKKEKKEKKEKADGGSFSLWDSAGTQQASAHQAVKQPQDKREKEREREKQEKKDGAGLIKVSTGLDVIKETMKKKQAAQQQEQEEKDKKSKANKKQQRMQEEKQQEEDETFQILDKSGLGNFMEKRDVLDIMKNTVVSAATSAGSRCQPSARTVIGDKVFTNKNAEFGTLGDFKATKGFVFVRSVAGEPGYKIELSRPSTLYVCLSEAANSDDPYLGSWEILDEDEMELPEFEGAKEVVEVRRKTYKDPSNRQVSVPKPPPGLDTVLLFVLPNFHADPFEGEESEDEEDKLARQRKEAADKRASKSAKAASSSIGAVDGTLDEKIEAILAKVEKGEKLTTREKKMHERHLEKNNPKYDPDADELMSPLSAFTLSLEGNKDPPPSGDAFSVENFSLSAPGQTLFNNASLTIVQGHRYGILGPNGMGKTTILRHIASRDLPVPLNWDAILVEQEAKASDRSAVDEVLSSDTRVADLLKREEELLRKLEEMEKAMEAGEDVKAEELEKTRDELETTAADLDASGAESAESRVRKILCGLGFTNGKPDEDRFSMDRPVVQFSGGWRMRISLAKALFLQPKLLMLDEPTNHLDLDAVLWLDNYLSDVYPHAVIVVSHDADFLDNICTDILHLEDKKLVHYRGDYTAFKKMHEQKRQTLDKEFKKQQDELKALKRKGKTKEEAEELIKKKFGIELHDSLMEKAKDYIVKFTFHGHGMDRTLGLNVSEVAFSYDGKEPWLLSECEIGVDCGSRIAIVGPNGAGKSTLLNLMMQQLEPCLGEVSASKGIRIRQYHQHFEELLPLEKTGVEYLSSAFDLSPPEKARATLGQFGLPGASHFTKVGNLSGGQKARVAFAALMLSKPHIIVLDEPTNHLDIESVEALTTAISNFNGGLVLVSHDARLITELDCELWVVEEGTCYRFEKGFEGYRDKVLDQLREREEEVERMEQRRREERAKKREKHVDKDRLEEARKRRATEAASEQEKGTAAVNEAAKKVISSTPATDSGKQAPSTQVKTKQVAQASDDSDEDEDNEDDDGVDDVNKETPANRADKARVAGKDGKQPKAVMAKETSDEEEDEDNDVDEEDDEDEEESEVDAFEERLKQQREQAKKQKVESESDDDDEDEGGLAAEPETAEKTEKLAMADKDDDWDDDSKGKKKKQQKKRGTQPTGKDKSQGSEVIANDKVADVDAQHEEYLVAEVSSVRAIKQKKGFFCVQMDVGAEEAVTVVTSLKNVMPGNRAILAMEGCKVNGKEVVAEHIHSEYSAGIICGPSQMGWPGDASMCIVLTDEATIGDFAPACATSPLVEGGDDKEDDEEAAADNGENAEEKADEEMDDKKSGGKKAQVAAAKAKGKQGKSAKPDDNVEEDEDQDLKPKKAQGARGKRGDDDDDEDGAGAKAKAKAKGKKGKNRRGDDSEEEEEISAPAKVKGKKGKNRRGDDSDEDEEEASALAKTKGKRGKNRRGDDSDAEEEPAPAKAKSKAKAKAQGKRRGKGDDDDEDEDAIAKSGADKAEEDDEEGGRKAKGKAKAKPEPKAQGKKSRGKRFSNDSEEEQEGGEEQQAKTKERRKPRWGVEAADGEGEPSAQEAAGARESAPSAEAAGAEEPAADTDGIQRNQDEGTDDDEPQGKTKGRSKKGKPKVQETEEDSDEEDGRKKRKGKRR